MSSKQLHSILNMVPAATVSGEKLRSKQTNEHELVKEVKNSSEETERIVAVIPKILKEEIKNYLKTHKGCTEKIIILKALKLMGFEVHDNWLIDKRSTR